MDQVEIVQVRLPARHPLEQDAFGDDLVGCGNGIIAGIGMSPEPNLPNSYLLSWNSPIYDPVRCSGSKPELDLGHRLHESEVQAERVGRALDLLDRRSDRNVLERTQDGRCRLLGRRLFGPDVANEIAEILRPRAGGTAICRRQLRGITETHVHRLCLDRSVTAFGLGHDRRFGNRCEYRARLRCCFRFGRWLRQGGRERRRFGLPGAGIGRGILARRLRERYAIIREAAHREATGDRALEAHRRFRHWQT